MTGTLTIWAQEPSSLGSQARSTVEEAVFEALGGSQKKKFFRDQGFKWGYHLKGVCGAHDLTRPVMADSSLAVATA